MTRTRIGEGATLPRSTSSAERAWAARWRSSWDRQQERYLPRREERFTMMFDLLAATMPTRFRALDIGTGTGSLSERLLTRFPRARSVGVDFDPVLLRLGRTALGDFGGRLGFVEADLRKAGWRKFLPAASFDAILSTTALHWFDGRDLARLYRDFYRLLRPGGLFLNGDTLAFPPNSRRLRHWVREARKASAQRRAPLPGVDWESWWERVAEDPRLREEVRLRKVRYPRPHSEVESPDLAGHVRRLRRAGFREVEVIWQRWEDRVLCGVR